MRMSLSHQPDGFKIICTICDGVGIVFECPEDAPSSNANQVPTLRRAARNSWRSSKPFGFGKARSFRHLNGIAALRGIVLLEASE
jgi:hypothetical protein